MQRNEGAWRKWYDENEPESVPIPDYDERINMDRSGTLAASSELHRHRSWGIGSREPPRGSLLQDPGPIPAAHDCAVHARRSDNDLLQPVR